MLASERDFLLCCVMPEGWSCPLALWGLLWPQGGGTVWGRWEQHWGVCCLQLTLSTYKHLASCSALHHKQFRQALLSSCVHLQRSNLSERFLSSLRQIKPTKLATEGRRGKKIEVCVHEICIKNSHCNKYLKPGY